MEEVRAGANRITDGYVGWIHVRLNRDPSGCKGELNEEGAEINRIGLGYGFIRFGGRYPQSSML